MLGRFSRGALLCTPPCLSYSLGMACIAHRRFRISTPLDCERQQTEMAPIDLWVLNVDRLCLRS
jgi:hypothetical protein